MTVTTFPAKFGTYLFTYRHAGSHWTMEIQAANADDARERLKALAFAQYDGELLAKVPVTLSLPATLIVWIRNLLARA